MRKVLTIFLISVVWQVSAQEHDRFLDVIPVHAIRWSPFHLIGFYPTVQVGYETKIKNRVTLYSEGGYALNFIERDDRFLDKRGFKAKLEPRYYATVNKKGTVTTYFGLELYHNHINFDRKETRTECFDVECQTIYQRRYLYTMKYRESGGGIKAGILLYAHNFFFDFNSGFAIRFIDYHKPSFPRQWNEIDDVGFFPVPNERSRTAFMPIIGIRIGYRMK